MTIALLSLTLLAGFAIGSWLGLIIDAPWLYVAVVVFGCLLFTLAAAVLARQQGAHADWLELLVYVRYWALLFVPAVLFARYALRPLLA